MIAHGFPPDGHAGVHRPLRFLRHLPSMGWHPTVIASDRKQQDRHDPGLLSLVPDEVEVVRIPGEDVWQRIQAWRGKKSREHCPGGTIEMVGELGKSRSSSIRSSIRGLVRRVESWYYHPDLTMPWIKSAVKATVKVCQRISPKVIWVTGGPWSSFVVARNVSLQTGVPYVLDFRDSWTLAGSPFYDIRPEWAQKRDQRLLYQLFKDAKAVIFRYHSEAECYWCAYPGALEPSRIHIIPNGFDGTIEKFKPIKEERSKCVILYAGTITPYRYDTFLQGVGLLKKTFPTIANQLQILFIGEGADNLAQEARTVGVSDIVETMSPISYAEVCDLQAKADALLLLGLIPMKGYELCGSKVFSYLKAGRPIIGVVPRDEMRNVLQQVGITTIADIDSPLEINTILTQVLHAWNQGTLSTLIPNPKACEAYSAEHQTMALVSALEGEPPAEAFVPGSFEIPHSLKDDIGTEGWVTGVK